VLRAIEAMPNGQAELFSLAESPYPRPLARVVTWITERRARDWQSRRMAVMRVWICLIEAGLVEIIIPADGMHPDLFKVSEAGRRWFAESTMP
jgi:hypothetical protein